MNEQHVKLYHFTLELKNIKHQIKKVQIQINKAKFQIKILFIRKHTILVCKQTNEWTIKTQRGN